MPCVIVMIRLWLRYVVPLVTAQIMDLLQEDIASNSRINGQFQFTTALERLRKARCYLALFVTEFVFVIV
jgi:hypothetical protein